MPFEFVDFYPFQRSEKKNKKALGTCHVYCIESQIDIRGILVLQNKGGYIFKIPEKFQIDPETQKPVRFPIVHFTSDEKKKEFFDALFQQGTSIIREKLSQQEPETAQGKCFKGPTIAQKTKDNPR